MTKSSIHNERNPQRFSYDPRPEQTPPLRIRVNPLLKSFAVRVILTSKSKRSKEDLLWHTKKSKIF